MRYAEKQATKAQPILEGSTSFVWTVLAPAAVFVLLAPLAYRQAGADGCWSAALAMSICVVAGCGGQCIARRFEAANQVLAGVVGGMLVRMAVPLLCLIVALVLRGRLAEAGLAVYLVVFYVTMLTVETWLAVRRVQSWRELPQG